MMSELTKEQLGDLISILNTTDVKMHIFKFVNDLYMVFGNEKNGFGAISSQVARIKNLSKEDQFCPALSCGDYETPFTASTNEGNSGHALNSAFFNQIDVLRKSCNDFQGI
jgi:hypothetical protein